MNQANKQGLCNVNTGEKFADNDIAVAILAAAIIGARPDTAPDAAVAQARRALAPHGARAIGDDKIAASVRRDKIQCLEDGSWHTMLRRYIARRYNMTPAQYRAKWGLPDDYPFVAPDYAKKRSRIAKNSGLGRK